jgi:hypothetical protein
LFIFGFSIGVCINILIPLLGNYVVKKQGYRCVERSFNDERQGLLGETQIMELQVIISGSNKMPYCLFYGHGAKAWFKNAG